MKEHQSRFLAKKVYNPSIRLFLIDLFRNSLWLLKLMIFEQIYRQILRAYAYIWSKNLSIKRAKKTILTTKWSFERGLIFFSFFPFLCSSSLCLGGESFFLEDEQSSLFVENSLKKKGKREKSDLFYSFNPPFQKMPFSKNSKEKEELFPFYPLKIGENFFIVREKNKENVLFSVLIFKVGEGSKRALLEQSLKEPVLWPLNEISRFDISGL